MRPVHPGKTLEAELKERGLSANAFSLQIGVPSNRISQIVKGQRGITADTALKLGKYFDNDPVYWLTLQIMYDLNVEKEKQRGQ